MTTFAFLLVGLLLAVSLAWAYKVYVAQGPEPETITVDGVTYVDGVDYFGPHDRDLILRCGYNGLNFHPSTPPEFR